MIARGGKLRVVVLISGSGSNLQALIDARGADCPFEIVAVISNRKDAQGLQRAVGAGITTTVVDHAEYGDRATFDTALAAAIDVHDPGLVVLAGFMRILTAAFTTRYAGRMINIHPSLLPSFQGLHTHRRALEAGVREHGASVHFVTAELDGGPVIAQAVVTVQDDDDEQALAARVLEREHELLPLVVHWFADNRLAMRDSRAWFDGNMIEAPLQC